MFGCVCGYFPHLVLWLVPSKPHTLEALVVPKFAGKTKTKFPLYPHCSYFVSWWMFVCVCGCFPHLVPWLVPSRPHTLEALVVPKFAGKTKTKVPLYLHGSYLGEVVGVCVCVCVWVFFHWSDVIV